MDSNHNDKTLFSEMPAPKEKLLLTTIAKRLSHFPEARRLLINRLRLQIYNPVPVVHDVYADMGQVRKMRCV